MSAMIKVLVVDDHPVVRAGLVGMLAADRRYAGYGLAGMRARVGEVGGELDVASTPGGGTRLTVRLPAVPA